MRGIHGLKGKDIHMKKLGFGFMRLPLSDKNDFGSIDIDTVKKMTDMFMEKGFCYFDTAFPYHREKSEEAIRECLVKRYPRDSFILADKMPTARVTSGDDYPVIFETQLERCGVEYFDCYLLHNIWKKSYRETESFGGFDFIREKMKEGRIKHFGFSFHDEPELLDEVLKNHPEAEFVQLQLNYLDWESPGVRARECYETARKYGRDIIVMEPNKGGSLINIPKEAEELFRAYDPDGSNAKWAMRFCASLPGVRVVLSGMSAIEQLSDNMSFMDDFRPFNDEEIKITEKVRDIVAKSAAIGCTKCRYCTEDCPAGIPIPEFIDAYNSYCMTKNMGNAGMYYRRYAMGRGLASSCLDCGNCEQRCPQHLKIRKILSGIADTFEPKN